jgi:pimeloyl-ACP methyl ester carboxylesterase
MDPQRAAGIAATGQNDMYVRESGTPGSPAVVFLHGVGNSGAMWGRHMGSEFHCLAPDLPGFGKSNGLAWTSRIDIADGIASLIETRVPDRRAHVVGLSLGGSIAHALLARHPDLLDRVVIDGCGALPWWGTGLIKVGVTAISPFLHTRAVIGMTGDAFGLDEDTRDDLRTAAPRAFRKGFAEANETRLTRAELEASCPTLLVAGEREMKPPVRATNAALAQVMLNAEARYVAGCGHGWLGEKPELHIRMVHAWITGQDLPPELLVETTPWDSSTVEDLIRPSAEVGVRSRD